MNAIILLNGEPYEGEIDGRDSYVFCCDGAYEWAKDKVKIDENLGDFDSLSYMPIPAPSEIYPSEKDNTDGELALKRAIECGYQNITIYGGGGGREDHFLGNLNLLYSACRAGVNAQMITNRARIFAAEGLVKIEGERGKTVSIVPFGGTAHIMGSSGLYYPLPERLCYGTTRGISNVVTDDLATFEVEGTVLVFVNL